MQEFIYVYEAYVTNEFKEEDLKCLESMVNLVWISCQSFEYNAQLKFLYFTRHLERVSISKISKIEIDVQIQYVIMLK